MQSRVLAILISVVLALVATAALVVYVNGADRRAIANQEPVQVWVAKELIPAGTNGQTAANRGLIERREVPRGSVTSETIVSLTQVVDRYAAVDIVPGEQLLRRRWVGAADVAGRRLLQIPADHQAVSIGLDLTRQVAGFVTPGDKVSMVLSMKRPGGGAGQGVDRTQFLLQEVQVLAVGATALANTNNQGGGGRVNQGKSSQNLTAVTLAVPKRDVLRVVYAAEYGSIYLTLLPPAAQPQPAPEENGVTADNVTPRAA